MTRTLQTDELAIADEDDGSGERGTVVLLHGWPDDASTWAAVAPVLNQAGLRTIVPTLRGFGDACSLDRGGTPHRQKRHPGIGRVRFAERARYRALLCGRARLGANIAEALAVGWPGRVERIALLSTPPPLGGMPTPPFWHAQLDGITGSWPRRVARRQCATTGTASRASHGRFGRRPSGSTRRPSTGWRARSTIRIGST